MNKHRIDEIRYIFKMRIGCDGSRETLHIRKLIDDQQINCHRCGVEETRKHIIENCEIYSRYRRKLERGINRK